MGPRRCTQCQPACGPPPPPPSPTPPTTVCASTPLMKMGRGRRPLASMHSISCAMYGCSVMTCLRYSRMPTAAWRRRERSSGLRPAAVPCACRAAAQHGHAGKPADDAPRVEHPACSMFVPHAHLWERRDPVRDPPARTTACTLLGRQSIPGRRGAGSRWQASRSPPQAASRAQGRGQQTRGAAWQPASSSTLRGCSCAGQVPCSLLAGTLARMPSGSRLRTA